MTSTCPECKCQLEGVEFYCPKCGNDLKSKNRIIEIPYVPISFFCPTCGHSFSETEYQKSKICPECRLPLPVREFSKPEKIVEKKPSSQCPECKKRFTKVVPNQIYCSTSCRELHVKNQALKKKEEQRLIEENKRKKDEEDNRIARMYREEKQLREERRQLLTTGVSYLHSRHQDYLRGIKRRSFVQRNQKGLKILMIVLMVPTAYLAWSYTDLIKAPSTYVIPEDPDPPQHQGFFIAGIIFLSAINTSKDIQPWISNITIYGSNDQDHFDELGGLRRNSPSDNMSVKIMDFFSKYPTYEQYIFIYVSFFSTYQNNQMKSLIYGKLNNLTFY